MSGTPARSHERDHAASASSTRHGGAIASRTHYILFSVGGFLFGVIGVIMAVPVVLVIMVTLTLLYDEPPNQALASK